MEYDGTEFHAKDPYYVHERAADGDPFGACPRCGLDPRTVPEGKPWPSCTPPAEVKQTLDVACRGCTWIPKMLAAETEERRLALLVKELERRALAAENLVGVLQRRAARREGEVDTIRDRDIRAIMTRTDDVEWAVGLADALEARRKARR